ncbi:hypothetical protein RP20_CCG025343 [Aedes albopictus]|nr:hypothetical protein RP20_CCG025343 [Aedes albopictus]
MPPLPTLSRNRSLRLLQSAPAGLSSPASPSLAPIPRCDGMPPQRGISWDLRHHPEHHLIRCTGIDHSCRKLGR